MNSEQLFELAAGCLNQMERSGSESLNDHQHALLAYCYLDSQVQEGGFVQLIASGYGDYVFANPLADTLRRWGVKATPKVLDKARQLYLKHGAAIEHAAEQGTDLDTLRGQFADFEELDADYYDTADEDLEKVCAYVGAHLPDFEPA